MIQRHLFALLLFVAFVPAASAADAVRPSAPAHPPGVAIASAHTLATQAGLHVIAQGGNAFDAAIAVSSTLSVVEPISSGLGGGGFFLLHDGKTGKDVFIDARETAPAAATPDKYLLPNGEFDRDRAENGPWAAGIPGLPAIYGTGKGSNQATGGMVEAPIAEQHVVLARSAVGDRADDDAEEAVEQRDDLVEAIRTLAVRGAPALGAAGALGVVVALAGVGVARVAAQSSQNTSPTSMK